MIFEVLDQVDSILHDGVIQPAFEAVSDFVAMPFRMGMILLVAAHGYKLLKGNTQELSTVDMWWLVAKMALVTELLINWSFFNAWVYDVIWDTYTGLADALADTLSARRGSILSSLGLSVPSTSMISLSAAPLDAAFSSQLSGALAQTLAIPESVNVGNYPIPIPGLTALFGDTVEIPVPILLPNLMGNIAGLIKFAMTIILFASVFIVMLLSRLALTSCLAVAPIFIALSLFQHTRSYTDAWFRGMLGIILTPLLLVLVLVVADATSSVLSGIKAPTGPLSVIGPAIAYLLLYYGLAKSVAGIPNFASGMVGSLLANIGDGAAHALVSGVQNAAAGAAKGFVTGGPGGAAAGAAKGVASAGSNGGVGVANGPMRMPARSTAAARR